MLYTFLLLLCFYLPFQFALNVSEGIDLASGRILVLALGLLWLLKSFAQKRVFIPNKTQTFLLFSFLFLSAFSLIFAQNTEWAYRKLLFPLSFIPLYFIAADYAQQKERAKRIISFLVYGAGAASLVGILEFFLQFFIGIDETIRVWQSVISPFLGNSFSQAVFEYPSWLVGIGGKTYLRTTALFPDPHMFSFYLGILLPFSVILAHTATSKAKRYILLAISVSILLADILTFSRGGYVGLIAALIAVLFLFKNKFSKQFSAKKIVLAGGVIGITALFFIFPNPVRERLSSSVDMSEGSNRGRIGIWKESLAVIKNNPLGVGIGNYAYEIKPSADYREPIYSHNLYLDSAAETGILNAAIFIALLIVTLLNFMKLSKNDGFYAAGAMSVIIFSTHSLFETPLFSIHIFPLLLIIIALSTTQNEYNH